MMPPRRWAKQRILNDLVVACNLPEHGQIEIRDRSVAELVFTDSGLRRCLGVFAASGPGILRWQVEVGDQYLRFPGTAAFVTSYAPFRDWQAAPQEPATVEDQRYRRHNHGYVWPNGSGPLDTELVDDVRTLAPAMLWFLKDRAELGRLLLHGRPGRVPDFWTRDGVTAMPYAGQPAGLVQAVILARVTGDAELETLALDKLQRERDQPANNFEEPFSQTVGYWAGQMAAQSPADISDLQALSRQRTRKKR
jgi:hypothetical protein